ncbi:MAG: ATP-dependent RNA helicase HrpA [Arcanobacterium sp.]|nr:ATP-dependent RNA helicase HrpA [Arcanobacterium sp.]
MPEITYPAELPVSAHRREIREAIAKNQVVIIAGETGSGKTTQIPKICLELGLGIEGMIGHTQPRRIAARSVAERISHELGVELGGAIGYQVRFTDHVGPTTLVKLMTDGILLAEIQSDPELRRYSAIIIDEAHERSLNIDFLLGYLAQLLPKRPDLKLIITSATIDSQRFAKHFGERMYGGFPGNTAPIIEVSGRTYPVEIRYRPLVEEVIEDGDLHLVAKDQVAGIVDAAEELMHAGSGDILVFLSGEGEILDTQKAFKDALKNRYVEPGARSAVPGAVEVLPLFARLSAAEQHRIFEPHQHRRIILATNIAETSITVPGIHYVIDPGTARISRFSNKTKVQRLPIENISQASANQRSGRSGRVANGIAIRLYSAEDFDARPQYTEPEILRTSLASVILQMASLGLGEVEKFPFIDPPELRSIRAGEQLLEEIGALQLGFRKPRLTKIGRQLARLPIDPRLGRMLLAAEEYACAAEVLVLVAAMSVQDVRERPAEFKAQSDQLHARFTEPSSDFLAYLNLWRYLRTQQRELSGSAFRRMCRAEFINWLRFREWQDVVAQLRELAAPLGLHLRPIAIPTHSQLHHIEQEMVDDGKDVSHNRSVASAVKKIGASSDAPASAAIHRALLVGLLSNIGNWDERKSDYLGARGTHFVIWPGSGLHKRNPKWVMAAELVETSRLFARTVARIDPAWVEELGAHLTKRQYSDPYWSTKMGAAMAHEKVTLYGLTLVAERPVLASKIGTTEAKEVARELFIRHALVENQWRAHHAFIRRNERAIAEAEEVAQRLRRHGLIADDAARFVFFDERIPDGIVSARHFDSWWKRERQTNPYLLDFTQDFLLGNVSASDSDFPSTWPQGELEFPITYTFNPGAYADGLVVDIPITVLPQVSPMGFDWLVPGMLDDLATSTIRALPKRLRKQLVPAPDVARDVIAMIAPQSYWAHAYRPDAGSEPDVPRRDVTSNSADTYPTTISSSLTTENQLDARKMPGTSELAEAASSMSFRESFTDAVRRLRGVVIDDAAWEEAEVNLPEHLRITFRVRSERGAVLDEGPSLEKLQRDLAPHTQSAVESVVQSAVAQALDAARDRIVTPTQRNTAPLGAFEDLHSWPTVQDGTIPATIDTDGPHGMTVRGYPALVEESGSSGTAVSLRVLTHATEQMRDHAKGIIRLAARELALPEARITSRWSGTEALILAGSPYPSTGALVDDLQLAAVRNLASTWAKNNKTKLGMIREAAQYDALKAGIIDSLEDEIYRIARIVTRVLSAWSEAQTALRETKQLAAINAVTETRDHLRELVYDGFIYATPDQYLADLPRYLAAASHRVRKAAADPDGDASRSEQIAQAEDLLATERHIAAEQVYDPERDAVLVRARWMIEELRVSLFAQQLGTKGKVSLQRIRKLLA